MEAGVIDERQEELLCGEGPKEFMAISNGEEDSNICSGTPLNINNQSGCTLLNQKGG
jgi:hypothetical protein